MDQFQGRDNLHALSVGDCLTGGREGCSLARRCPLVLRLPSKAASTGTTVAKRATEAARSRKTNLCIMNECVEMDGSKRKECTRDSAWERQRWHVWAYFFSLHHRYPVQTRAGAATLTISP